MYQTLESQIVLGLVVLSVAFAWWKGGAPERVGALFNGVICLGVTIVQALIHESLQTLPILIADGLLAVGFLILAIRYASLWLGAAMLLQAMAFSMHSALLLGVLQPGIAYYAAMNVMSLGVLLSIILGTAYAWVIRRRKARMADA
jgi:hypothetical protein